MTAAEPGAKQPEIGKRKNEGHVRFRRTFHCPANHHTACHHGSTLWVVEALMEVHCFTFVYFVEFCCKQRKIFFLLLLFALTNNVT